MLRNCSLYYLTHLNFQLYGLWEIMVVLQAGEFLRAMLTLKLSKCLYRLLIMPDHKSLDLHLNPSRLKIWRAPRCGRIMRATMRSTLRSAAVK